MIEADAFLDAVKMSGADFFTGVPCSFLTPLINRTISDPSTQYVGAASEGEAVAIAAGAWLAGRETVVMCQNSGLGNTVNPLTSLNFPFRIPTVLIVTWRGEPGLGDEPQHELMGEITGSLLDVMRIPWSMFPETPEAIDEAIGTASASLRESRLPYAFIMRKGAVADAALMAEPRPIRARGTLQRETPKPAHVPRHKVLERWVAVKLTAEPAPIGATAATFFKVVDVIPAVLVKRIFDHGSAEQNAHLAAGHPRFDRFDIFDL
ncbi:MAG: thiamine pyrophosphate-binding protein [Pseudomonadota bacterium]